MNKPLVFTFIGIVAVIGIIVGVVVGLRGGGDPGASTSTTTPSEVAGEERGPATSGDETELVLPAKQSGELRIFGPDPLTLDPALVTDAGSARYIVEIFSGLLTLDKDTLQPAPDIAESVPEPVLNDDGTVTYTFSIRRNVLFQDSSRQVTANDFKYSMERALAPSTLSTVAKVFLGDIVGANDFARGRVEEVSGISVVDNFTLQITIDGPKPYFLAKLANPPAFVVKREQVDGNPNGWTAKPIGTGPFRLDEWRLGERISLIPNPNFHLDPRPSLERVTFLLAGGSPLTMYENSEIDATGVGINDIESIRDPHNPLNTELIEEPDLTTFYIGFNAEVPPFDDHAVRRAFGLAIDRDALVRIVLKDLVVEALGILPPGLPGYNSNVGHIPFDPATARELLASSRYADNLPDIVLTSAGQGATAGPVLDTIIAMWADNLGVNVEVQLSETALFFQDLDTGDIQMFDSGWIADYADPQNFIEFKFYSQNIGTTNDVRYSNPDVDALIERAQTEQDEEARLRLYQEAEQIILDEAAWIPLFHDKDAILVKPNVVGFEASPMTLSTLRYVSLAEQ